MKSTKHLYNEFIRWFHQSRIPNLRIFVMISFSTGKLRKKNCFGPIRNLFSFSKAQTEKNWWKKIHDKNW